MPLFYGAYSFFLWLQSNLSQVSWRERMEEGEARDFVNQIGLQIIPHPFPTVQDLRSNSIQSSLIQTTWNRLQESFLSIQLLLFSHGNHSSQTAFTPFCFGQPLATWARYFSSCWHLWLGSNQACIVWFLSHVQNIMITTTGSTCKHLTNTLMSLLYFLVFGTIHLKVIHLANVR